MLSLRVAIAGFQGQKQKLLGLLRPSLEIAPYFLYFLVVNFKACRNRNYILAVGAVMPHCKGACIRRIEEFLTLYCNLKPLSTHIKKYA